MSTNLEYRERGERERERERERKKEKVGRQTSEAKLNEKKSYSEREKTNETFFWRNNMKFCSGDEKMRNASEK